MTEQADPTQAAPYSEGEVMVDVIQDDRDAAAALFLDVLYPVGSYAEWGYSSDRETATLEMAETLARYREAAAAKEREQVRKDLVQEIVVELKGMHPSHKWTLPEVADLIERKYLGEKA